MHIQNVQVVETVVESIADLKFKVDHRVKDTNFLELHKLVNVSHLPFEGFDSVELFDKHAVNRYTQEVFDFAFEGRHVIILKLGYEVLLELQKQLIGVGEMEAFSDHVGWVFECLKQELKSFASVWVLDFVDKY